MFFLPWLLQISQWLLLKASRLFRKKEKKNLLRETDAFLFPHSQIPIYKLMVLSAASHELNRCVQVPKLTASICSLNTKFKFQCEAERAVCLKFFKRSSIEALQQPSHCNLLGSGQPEGRCEEDHDWCKRQCFEKPEELC